MPSRRPALTMAPILALFLGAASLPAGAQTAPQVTGGAGAYLAARAADGQADFAAAADWYGRALAADPQNEALLKGALLSQIGLGNFDLAAALADQLQQGDGAAQLAWLVRVDQAARADDFAALDRLGAPGAGGGPAVEGLVQAWAALGQGRSTDALAAFDKLATTKGIEGFGLYHKALALALAGDFGGADDILSGKAAGPVSVGRRGVLAHVQILSQLERNADAAALLDRAFGPSDQDPQLVDLRHRLAAGEPLAFDAVRNPRDGLAEVFFTMATALNGQADDVVTLLYARIAADLRPDLVEAQLLAAGLLEQLGQHDLAAETYARIPASSPVFHVAELGRAEAAFAAGRRDAAREILTALARAHPDLVPVQVALADQLRREERYAEARTAYDGAIALIAAPEPQHWSIFYARGMCAERLGDFAGAEADMRAALALQPDQPQVLNFLGYSLVDRGEKLDEALQMINRAVQAEPQAGYIIDSLAWAYFRLGRYDEAVAPMERASLLEPVDPTVTDHLGDVYWMAGRQREAEFQWRRALSFDPDEKLAERIRAKLERGLEAVMAEEAAAPAPAALSSDGD